VKADAERIGLAPQTLEDQRRSEAPAVDHQPIAIAQGQSGARLSETNYLQIVESRRDGSSVRQHIVATQELVELAGVEPILRPPERRGPVGPCDDATVLEHIRKAIAESRFTGEGYRKIWPVCAFPACAARPDGCAG
jgi:hypothetical protein